MTTMTTTDTKRKTVAMIKFRVEQADAVISANQNHPMCHSYVAAKARRDELATVEGILKAYDEEYYELFDAAKAWEL